MQTLLSFDNKNIIQRPRIAVVMSTYNGAEHIKEQLDSILIQDMKPDFVIVRDDGSSDDTVPLLREYVDAGAIQLIEGHNLGVVGSFLNALSAVPADVDYVFLSDQDDVWHVNKISRAVFCLEKIGQSEPCYYCAEYTFCDARMNRGERSHLLRNEANLAHMLYENPTSGNTCAINRPLLDLVVQAGSRGVYCHDWWLALVASALGYVIHDDFDCLDYRRTGSNASPTGMGFFRLLRYRMLTFFKKGEFSKITEQINRLYELYAYKMSTQKRDLLARFVYGNRLMKIFVPFRLRQKIIDDIVLRVLFLLGLL